MRHQPISQADGHADSLTGRIYELIAEALDVMPAELMPGSVLRDDLGADDDDIDRLRRRLDRGLGIYVPAPDAQRWRQVADVVAYVTKRVQG